MSESLVEGGTQLKTRGRIWKRLRSPRINSKESIPPAYVALRSGMSNRVVVPARQGGNRFLGSLKRLQIRARLLRFLVKHVLFFFLLLVCLCVCLPACLRVCLSVCMFVCLFVDCTVYRDQYCKISNLDMVFVAYV
jgi:hypothetical protein